MKTRKQRANLCDVTELEQAKDGKGDISASGATDCGNWHGHEPRQMGSESASNATNMVMQS